MGVSTTIPLPCERIHRRGQHRLPTCDGEGGHAAGRVVAKIYAASQRQRCTTRLLPLRNCEMKAASFPLHRRSIRLAGYDYSQPGAYFVTIVTAERRCLFGEIVGDEMVASVLGNIV